VLGEALALDWADQEFTEVRPGIFGATIDSEQLTVTVYRYEPGCAWEEHRHPEDQVTCVLEGGTVDFVVAGRPVPLSAGALAVIPGGTPHSASVPAGGERVVTLNVWRLRT
jgi:quercetin dioxygenase-like cupin family protein